MVHWQRNVTAAVPCSKAKETIAMLKTMHAQKDHQAALKKGAEVVAMLWETKLFRAAKIVEERLGETLSYMAYPCEHRIRIRTNSPLERIMREIRRRIRVVGRVPQLQRRADARGGPTAAHCRDQVRDAQVSRHGPTE